MKRFFYLVCAFSICTCAMCGEHILSLTSELCGSKSQYLSIPRVDIEEITPFTHTIAYNYGDTILALFTPPIGDQGPQQSCAGWALGYGCASIQAYDVYQDWNWAKRSPSFLYNQGNTHSLCDVVKVDTILKLLFNQGVCSYYLMPYITNDCSAQPDSIQYADAILNRSARLRLTDTTDVSEYKQILQVGHPIGVVTKYANDLETLCNTPSAQGRWTSITNTDTTNSHTMCIVGYDDHQHMFKAMNSWGTSSGDNGFVWISYSLVQSGVFSEAYVFDSRGNGFVPQIEGPTYFCDTTYYYMRNVPSGATIQWSMSSAGPMTWLTLIGPTNRDSVMVARVTGNIPVRDLEYGDDITGGIFPPYTGDTSMILNANISSAGNSYTTTKKIYKSTAGSPTISASNSASTWPMGTTRTFTITNCTEVPDSLLKWQIRRRSYHNAFLLVESGQGRSITFTPNTTGYYMIKAINTGNTCGVVSSSLYYSVIYSGRHQLAAYNDGSVIRVTIYEDQASQLILASLEENSEYTLELWHSIYGLMRTKVAESATEQMSTTGLPQGVYVLLLKENGNVIAETKVMIQ